MRLVTTLLLASASFLSLEGCCESGLRSVGLILLPERAGVNIAYVWTGDSLTLSAVAGTDPHEFCYHELFTSATFPGRFSYQSTSPSVAAVSPLGELVAQSVGTTTVTVMTTGLTSYPLNVVVSPPIASIRFSAVPPTIKVGDTLNVRIDALDDAGQVVMGGLVDYGLLRSQDSIATTVLAPRPVPPSVELATPLTIRLRGVRAGIATLQVQVLRYTVSLQPVITATIDITVAP
jgi:hypothetical protein